MKIYTKKGDQGLTQSWNGVSINKNSLELEVQGIADELISYLGIIKQKWIEFFEGEKSTQDFINNLQNKLFDLCAICSSEEKADSVLNIQESMKTEFLEEMIDKYNDRLPPLKNFILPGDNHLSSQVHYCRAKVRTLERRVVALSENNSKIKDVIPLVNRSSDLFFVMARYISIKSGKQDSQVSFTKR